mgnify:CR=1 FL=1
MKILLVEDNVSLCRNIASVLQNEGYTVVTCSNGNEAEFQMLNNSSDLILLDRMLPGKDGITLTREARTAGITVPLLLLTALDTLGDKVTGLDAGADDYIVSPLPWRNCWPGCVSGRAARYPLRIPESCVLVT